MYACTWHSTCCPTPCRSCNKPSQRCACCAPPAGPPTPAVPALCCTVRLAFGAAVLAAAPMAQRGLALCLRHASKPPTSTSVTAQCSRQGSAAQEIHLPQASAQQALCGCNQVRGHAPFEVVFPPLGVEGVLHRLPGSKLLAVLFPQLLDLAVGRLDQRPAAAAAVDHQGCQCRAAAGVLELCQAADFWRCSSRSCWILL